MIYSIVIEINNIRCILAEKEIHIDNAYAEPNGQDRYRN